MKTHEFEYIRFELRSIDAWRYDGLWEWNASYQLEDGLYFSESALTPRQICKALREWQYLAPTSTGRIRVYYDGDVYEIQNRKTGEPLLALIPSS